MEEGEEEEDTVEKVVGGMVVDIMGLVGPMVEAMAPVEVMEGEGVVASSRDLKASLHLECLKTLEGKE